MASQETQSANTDTMSRNRRSSVTTAALSSIFRSNSMSSGVSGTPVFPGPITSAALDQNRRRRLSISTSAALGINNSPVSAGALPFGARRASMSTSSSSSDTAIDESAIDDDDVSPVMPRSNTNSFARRTSFGAQAMRNIRGPGASSPIGASSNDQGYNWPEQFRSRAESSVTGSRPSFSYASGTGSSGVGQMRHDRAKSVSDVPMPPVTQPAAQPAPRPRREARPKPDHFQERILKGDFYMD